ncbi:GNAT family N-acetyltransferase [Microbacterium sp.]|uniref:GNAT family N-acetyltransferase n=1 Tax=Microbacterium sp. TaxID=51671 RepID=UPI002B5FEA46|nr:GNAT family N-acetyltransferase [Microbacterium sp.]HWL77737.1 GNAT family N-acetyltransferase [Microbacterium sp.]
MRVDDRHRGAGIGRALLRHIVADARERGYESLWLETGTPPDFLPARASTRPRGSSSAARSATTSTTRSRSS